MIAIINYGMGNLRSVEKAFLGLKIPVCVTSDAGEISAASKLVLPGVGHFYTGMENLKKSGLERMLIEEVLGKRKPVLGICLGMQLMTDWSEEGDAAGLGWVAGRTQKFRFEKEMGLKVPHIGWNTVELTQPESALFGGYSHEAFYFVHSYFITCDNVQEIFGTTRYGVEFVSAFRKENIWGTQFHPEKSHDAGLRILKKFADDR
jgi:glutamine amidotransferase